MRLVAIAAQTKVLLWTLAILIAFQLVADLVGIGTRLQIRKLPGRHEIEVLSQDAGEMSLVLIDGEGIPRATSIGGWSFQGFGYAETFNRPHSVKYYVPYWSLILPMLCIYGCARRFTRKRQIAESRCRICHYDLRAHKPNQKCPECGTPIPRFGWRTKS